MPGIKFALGENPKDMPTRRQRDRPAPLPDDAHGRRVRHPRRVHARQGVPEGVAGLREEQGAAGRAAAAPRPAARAARRDPRRQAPGARALLPRGRDPDADPPRRGDGLQDRDLPARARGLQGREGDRRARRRRLDLLRLVGLQDRSGGRDSPQRRDHGAQGRARLDQLRQRRARAPPEHRGGQVDEVGRAHRGRGARAGHDQSGEAAAHRQPRRLARSRQGRRRRRLERTIRSAPTRSSSASTSTAPSTTTARAKRAGSPRSRKRSRASRPPRAARARRRPTRRRTRAQATTVRAVRVATTMGRSRRRADRHDAARRRRRRRRRPSPRRLAPARSSPSPTPRIHPITRADDRERHDRACAARRSRRSAPTSPVPAGAKVVDAAGADVYPGFINARTQMGLNEPGPRGFEDVSEMLDCNPQLRTRVAYHSESDAIAGRARQRHHDGRASCRAAARSAAKSRS